MTLDDLPLERSDPRPRPPFPPPAPSSSSPVRWIVLAAVAVILGGGLTLWWLSRAQPGTATPASTAATDVAVVSNRPKRQNLDLPSLDNSDSFLRPLVAALSQHPMLAKLLATQGLIRGMTLATVQIGDGKTPASPFAVLRPPTHVTILGTASGKIDPASFKRWDNDVDALVSIQPHDLAQLYVNVELLFDQSYHELGYPDKKFDEAIVRAMDTLADTPLAGQDIVLIRKQPGFYDHDNPNLRTLLPVQKQLLLMGPENRQRIQDWLNRVARELDLKVG